MSNGEGGNNSNMCSWEDMDPVSHNQRPNGKTQKQPERYLEARYYENQLLFLKLSELKLNFEL